MGKIYADKDGNLLRVLDTPELERMFPDPPEGATQVRELDGISNKSVFEAIATDHNAHRLVSGVLVRNGETVTIASDGSAKLDRDRVRALLTKLASADPLTQAEIKALFRFLLRKLGEVVD